MTKSYPQNLSLEQLLLTSKALAPLADEELNRLREIERLDVANYSEADVRATVIDPIVRALGYKKGTYFSIEREKPLKVMGKALSIDYNMILMRENFWVIEAKKVKRKVKKFSKDEIHQALVYASHPEINAALLVISDGRILHVFDREESLEAPILEIEIVNLVEEFDKLRKILSPWQVWFFEKRRILRLLDKVFDCETNMDRVSEFQELISGRLDQKRDVVVRNYQNKSANFNSSEHINYLSKLHYCDLINIHLPINHTIEEINTISKTLVEHCKQNSFDVIYKIFPDIPSATNDYYWAGALHFLFALDYSGQEINWLPTYLRDESEDRPTTAMGIKKLIAHCLNGFSSNPDRQYINLYAASVRRYAKQMLVRISNINEIGKLQHALFRHNFDELSWYQLTSSPDIHRGQILDNVTYTMTKNMISQCTDDRNNFNSRKARELTKNSWRLEKEKLGDGSEYISALSATNIPEAFPSEIAYISYDNLGHLCLCMINSSQKWKQYTIENHAAEIRKIAQYGSFIAHELLGKTVDFDAPPSNRPSTQEIADRFFFGDINILQNLSSSYRVFI